jgi:hypothetical protein
MDTDKVTRTKLFAQLGTNKLYERTLVSHGNKRLDLVALPFDVWPARFEIVIEAPGQEIMRTLCYNLDEAIREYNEAIG